MQDNFLQVLLTSTKDQDIVPLSLQEEKHLIRVARTRNDAAGENARKQLLLQYGPILRASLINYKIRLQRGGHHVESDLELIGMLVEHFLELMHNLDVERYILFNKVAFYLKDALDDDFGARRPVTIPGDVVDRAQRVRKLTISGAALTPKLLRTHRLTLDGYNDYVAAFEVPVDLGSISEEEDGPPTDGAGQIYPELIAFDQYEKKEDEIYVGGALDQLNYEERLIISTTFELDDERALTEVEMATMLGWTRHKVRTTRKDAMRKMRRFLEVKIMED